jgi:hypothetical protein
MRVVVLCGVLLGSIVVMLVFRVLVRVSVDGPVAVTMFVFVVNVLVGVGVGHPTV